MCADGTLCGVLRDYQSGWGALLGALIGFAALAWVTRWSHREQRERDELQQRQAEHSLIRALLTEIVINEEPLRARLSSIDRALENNTTDRLRFESRHWISGGEIFRGVRHNLGLLDEELAGEVASYYLTLFRLYKEMEQPREDKVDAQEDAELEHAKGRSLWVERRKRVARCIDKGEDVVRRFRRVLKIPVLAR